MTEFEIVLTCIFCFSAGLSFSYQATTIRKAYKKIKSLESRNRQLTNRNANLSMNQIYFGQEYQKTINDLRTQLEKEKQKNAK